jgi:hypothetical protein
MTLAECASGTALQIFFKSIRCALSREMQSRADRGYAIAWLNDIAGNTGIEP